MKLTYVVSMFPCWSETFILNELVNHAQSGVAVDVFSLKNCNESMVHEEAQQFIESTTYSLRPSNPLLWLKHLFLMMIAPVVYFKILTRLLFLKTTDKSIKLKSLAVFALAPTFVFASKKNKTTHLHAHFATYPALLAWVVGQFTHTPFSFTAHAHDIYFNQDLLPLLCDDAAVIITISEFNKRFITEKIGQGYEGKIKVIHCGIDLSRFTYDTERSFHFEENHVLNILSIGRLSGIKGFTYLIEALRLLKNDGVLFRCNIIGDGPLKEQLVKQVEHSNLSEQVFFLGSKNSDEIPEYLRNSDVFVLACATDKVEIHDGIPVVFMEAMAYGVPVIGTRLSGIPELIRHMDTGLCAETENPDSLKDTIKMLLDNQKKIYGMTKKARELIERDYDIDLNSSELKKYFL